jgi:hypothetical protein
MIMKKTTKKIIELFVALMIGFWVTACGESATGMRGQFGTSSSGSGSDSLQSSTSTGLNCIATALKATVASSEVFQVQVDIYNASGAVSIPGTNASGSSSSMKFTTSYKNTYGMDVYWNPSFSVSDSSTTAKCSFQVLVLGSATRQF